METMRHAFGAKVRGKKAERKDREGGGGLLEGGVHFMKEREGGERINEGVRERQGGKNARPAVLNT